MAFVTNTILSPRNAGTFHSSGFTLTRPLWLRTSVGQRRTRHGRCRITMQSPSTDDDTAKVLDAASRATRREFLRAALNGLGLVALSLPLLTSPMQSVHAKPAEKLERLTAPIVMCQRLMGPVDRYITEGAWDKGRTNVNYCTRVLAMRRNMKDAASQLEGDAYYEALDIMGEMENIMTQLDASLYTPLFIPADEGVSPEQSRYQSQARVFYAQAQDGFERFLQLVPPEVLSSAIDIANNAKYEIAIERS